MLASSGNAECERDVKYSQLSPMRSENPIFTLSVPGDRSLEHRRVEHFGVLNTWNVEHQVFRTLGVLNTRCFEHLGLRTLEV